MSRHIRTLKKVAQTEGARVQAESLMSQRTRKMINHSKRQTLGCKNKTKKYLFVHPL